MQEEQLIFYYSWKEEKKTPIPADNFKKYNTKHNPKISILKPKIWVKQENWVSNISILLQNQLVWWWFCNKIKILLT